MEDMGQLIVAIIIVIGALSSAARKKMKHPSAPNAASAGQKFHVDPPIANQPLRQSPAVAPNAVRGEARPQQVRPAPVPPSYQPPRMGQEGEDACHEYMLGDTPAVSSPEGGAARTIQENELVRAVVMAEILRRPAASGSRRRGL